MIIKHVRGKRHVPKARTRYTSKAYRRLLYVMYAVMGLNVANALWYRMNGPGHMRKYLAHVDPVRNPLDERGPLKQHTAPAHPGTYNRKRDYAKQYQLWASTAAGIEALDAIRHTKSSSAFLRKVRND